MEVGSNQSFSLAATRLAGRGQRGHSRVRHHTRRSLVVAWGSGRQNLLGGFTLRLPLSSFHTDGEAWLSLFVVFVALLPKVYVSTLKNDQT